MSKEKRELPGNFDAVEQIWKSFAKNTAFDAGQMDAGVTWLETMSDFGAEWLRFVADRVHEDVETQHKLLHAKDLKEIQDIQTGFFQKAMDDYRSETGKVMEMFSKRLSELSN